MDASTVTLTAPEPLPSSSAPAPAPQAFPTTDLPPGDGGPIESPLPSSGTAEFHRQLAQVVDLHGCVASFARVLRAGGRAVCVITHPCFSSRRPGSYFDEQTFEERWGAFVTPFVTHHRPLSRYFAAFFAAGFAVEAFEEPVVALPAPPELAPEKVARYRSLPYSVAVALRKPP